MFYPILIDYRNIISFFFFLFFFKFLGPHLRHMESSRLEAESAYTIAIATQDPSLVCNLHHSSQQHQILNLLSEARERTHILMGTNQVCNPLSHNRNSLERWFLEQKSESREFLLWFIRLRTWHSVHEDTASIPDLSRCVKDLVWLWLWSRPTAAAPIWPLAPFLAVEVPYATGAVEEKKKKW